MVEESVLPPSYTPVTMVPFYSPESNSKRFYFVNVANVSFLQNDMGGYNKRVNVQLAKNSQRKAIILTTPPGIAYNDYVSQFLPHFVKISNYALNPAHIMEVYPGSANFTKIDMVSECVGRSENASGTEKGSALECQSLNNADLKFFPDKMQKLPAIEQLNQLAESDFFEIINTLFETAPPLQRKLIQNKPYSSYTELIDQSDELIKQMNLHDQILVVNAHPRIGAPAQTLSEQSKKEQGNQVSPEVLERLAKLNKQYEDKFGFKFVVFVNGRSRQEIVGVIEQRMNNTKEEELKTGLRDMTLIARDRLSKLE
ncbi:hypothetical protein HDV01_000860 [Terramyces sp. JEL0728]|nr:hypothetical protein HDV01_000860 [Terramyces sp. JEL0728]